MEVLQCADLRKNLVGGIKMIESIKLSDVASFTGDTQVLSNFSKFNYFFGSNGTGKTTISRLIAEPSNFSSCVVKWENDIEIEALVYNRDYVEKTFSQAEGIPGVFTLGKDAKKVEEEIKELNKEIGRLEKRILGLEKVLNGNEAEENVGKRMELFRIEDELTLACWKKKQKYDDYFKMAFSGVRGTRESFKNKVKAEARKNKAELKTLEYLKEQAKKVFAETSVPENEIPVPDFSPLIEYEADAILKKVIVGKEDLDIAKLISQLNNSDWVKKGMDYYTLSQKRCPFCQQKTTDELEQNLNAYFDEEYLADMEKIKKLNRNYVEDANGLSTFLEELISTSPKNIKLDALKKEKELFDSIIALNKQKLRTKADKASQATKLESIKEVGSKIDNLISEANLKIKEHNRILQNLEQENNLLVEQVWRYIIEELHEDISNYDAQYGKLTTLIQKIEKRIEKKKEQVREKRILINGLEKQSTSTIPTCNAINDLLTVFGFTGFRLDVHKETNYYKLIRPDGSSAETTLSEGERSFITFLYFYHLLKGSQSQSGLTENRIAVFDDPVSSLDSNILFIVSSLIKKLIEEVRVGEVQIKQIFILTHNVYFHKEVTYNPKRTNNAMEEETFWIVRKPNQTSFVESYNNNPVKTSYELLWHEVRRNDRSNLTIQNILRRILENYFKVLGGINLDNICEKFEGQEQIVCASLCSWMHDGSHLALDDLYVSVDDNQVDMFLKVFKQIFINENHLAHYNMMMGIEEESA